MLQKIYCAAVTLIIAASIANAETRPGGIADLRIAKDGKGAVAEAWLAGPTDRYRHFVLGSNYEASSLVVRLKNGQTITLELGVNSVFEDREPRFADLDGDGSDEIVVVRSYMTKGAAVAVVGLRDGALKIIAETPPTGRPNTWINPAGIADFDGDGQLDIAYVQMPHILGLLRLWTFRDGKFVEIATLPDTSNHIAGSPHLRLSAVADFDGDGTSDLAIPSRDRRTLRFIRFKGGAREIGRKSLPKPAASDFSLLTVQGKPVVRVPHADKTSTDVTF